MITDDSDVSIFLSHSGVLGMHWGHHKLQETSPTNSPTQDNHHLTTKQRNELIIGGSAIVIGAVVAGALFYHQVPISALAGEMSHIVNLGSAFKVTKDIILPKNTDFHRVAGQLETSVDSPKYAVYSKRDMLKYRTSWSSIKGKTGKYDYRTKFTANKNVKIASADSLSNMAADLFKGTDAKSKLFQKQAADLPFFTTKPWVKALPTPEELGKRFSSASTTTDWLHPSQKTLLDYAKTKGYSGITDINNTGSLAQHAVVLFNNEVFNTSGHKLTQTERNLASKAFQKLEPALQNIM